jgi:hypothetical protein
MTATLKRRVVAEFSDRSRGARPRLIIQSTWPQEPHPCEAIRGPQRQVYVRGTPRTGKHEPLGAASALPTSIHVPKPAGTAAAQ